MVYEVEKFALIGKTIYLYDEVDYLSLLKEKNAPVKLINDKTGGVVVKHSRRLYIENLQELEGEGAKVLMRKHFHTYLPYFADVTQDLPTSSRKLGLIPETYKNCQLLAETHGGYLQFFDWKTREIHRIAMNSNTYTPVK